MHLIDIPNGLYGRFRSRRYDPIARCRARGQMDGNGECCVLLRGGATEEGVFHESMNLAAL